MWPAGLIRYQMLGDPSAEGHEKTLSLIFILVLAHFLQLCSFFSSPFKCLQIVFWKLSTLQSLMMIDRLCSLYFSVPLDRNEELEDIR